ncbi:MAG: L-lactate permease [Gemmatimonadaceae bacterium]|nr:L-lactate permease [Gemmatimonadaceae bacterium]
MWPQTYDPLHSPVLSTLVAAVPLVVLLGLLARHEVRAHWAAVAGLTSAVLVAIVALGMPAPMALATAAYGALYGLFPIGWIVVNVIFLYRLTSESGYFAALQGSITRVTDDRRLQLVLIAFSFGAFFEGAAGFGTPVAVTGALLIGLGFTPLQASGLSLIANTAPVAYGALGTPIIALQGVTGLDLLQLSAMVGRQLPVFSIIVPFWLMMAYVGFGATMAVWPALLVAGVAFAVPQWAISNLHGPWLVDVGASVCSMGALVAFLKVWKPKTRWTGDGEAGPSEGSGETGVPAAPAEEPPSDRGPGLPNGAQRASPVISPVRAWVPWIVLSVLVFLWGLPQVKGFLNGLSAPAFPVPGLHLLVQRMPPVVAQPTAEGAVFTLNWLSATGSAICLAAMIGGLLMGYRPAALAREYVATLKVTRTSLLTIAAMLSLGYVSRYAGMDAILGLAFAQTGVLYPFFGALLGWLGVALTGSDTSSNVLFGSLQTLTAQQVGVSPTLMAAANSTGGVMGKMIDAQSIVVASTATRWYGQEGRILRFVFWHSLALAALVGLLVLLQAYVPPFTRMVVAP